MQLWTTVGQGELSSSCLACVAVVDQGLLKHIRWISGGSSLTSQTQCQQRGVANKSNLVASPLMDSSWCELQVHALCRQAVSRVSNVMVGSKKQGAVRGTGSPSQEKQHRNLSKGKQRRRRSGVGIQQQVREPSWQRAGADPVPGGGVATAEV